MAKTAPPAPAQPPQDLVTEYLHNITEPDKIAEVHGRELQRFLNWMIEHKLIAASAELSQEKP